MAGNAHSWQRWQLHAAAGDGNLPLVAELIAGGYPINRFDELGKTPLHHAVAADQFDVAELLIRAGADVNAHDERVIGNTPLGDVSDRCSLPIAKLLLQAGADPTIPGWMQLTALDRAEDRKDVEGAAVRQLLADASKLGKRPKRRGPRG